MRTTTLPLALLFATLFTLSCSKVSQEPVNDLSEYQVPLKQAEMSIYQLGQKWRATLDSLNIPQDSILPTQGFTVSAVDLIGVIGPGKQQQIQALCRYTTIRVYLGWVTATQGNSNLHLYLTPVDENGDDVILKDNEGEAFVYDLTSPCPNTCDVNSPLFSAFTQLP